MITTEEIAKFDIESSLLLAARCAMRVQPLICHPGGRESGWEGSGPFDGDVHRERRLAFLAAHARVQSAVVLAAPADHEVARFVAAATDAPHAVAGSDSAVYADRASWHVSRAALIVDFLRAPRTTYDLGYDFSLEDWAREAEQSEERFRARLESEFIRHIVAAIDQAASAVRSAGEPYLGVVSSDTHALRKGSKAGLADAPLWPAGDTSSWRSRWVEPWLKALRSSESDAGLMSGAAEGYLAHERGLGSGTAQALEWLPAWDSLMNKRDLLRRSQELSHYLSTRLRTKHKPAGPSHQVFISYASEDADQAASLKEALSQRGISAYLAAKDLVLGDQWFEKIQGAIWGAKCFVVLITEKSRDRSWVQMELGAALMAEKDICPVVTFTDIERVPAVLARWKVSHLRTPHQWNQVVEDIEKILRA